MSVDWSYFNRFDWADKKYLPDRGEGETMATQIVTAVSKLVYKWYNDGDVFDNRYAIDGFCNDLSSYANWLIKYIPDKAECLYDIENISSFDSYSQYEDLLKELTDATHDKQYLEEMDQKPKVGSIYECEGPFRFEDFDDEEEWG